MVAMDSPDIDEDARRRFEAAWIQDAPLPLDQCLPAQSDPLWLPTLEELVAIELEFGWKARPAGGPLLETYFERYPALKQAAIARRLVQQEYDVRQEVGDRPTRRQLSAAFHRVGGRLGPAVCRRWPRRAARRTNSRRLRDRLHA